MLRKVLIGVAGLIGLGYLGAVAYMWTQETRLVFRGASEPDSPSIVPDGSRGVPWDSLRVTGSDGVPVFLVESRLEESARRPWAIYFHGRSTLVGSPRMVDRYALLREAGFNVLAVEFRGYGAAKASGPPSEAGLYEDARAAWTHLRQTLNVPPTRVALYGYSMGSGVATQLGAEVRPAALITEGAYTALFELVAAQYPWFPVRLIMRNRFNSLERAGKMSLPWLILHARLDDQVPVSHAEALAAEAPQGRLVWLDADHDDGVMGDRNTALAELRRIAQGIPLARISE